MYAWIVRLRSVPCGGCEETFEGDTSSGVPEVRSERRYCGPVLQKQSEVHVDVHVPLSPPGFLLGAVPCVLVPAASAGQSSAPKVRNIPEACPLSGHERMHTRIKHAHGLASEAVDSFVMQVEDRSVGSLLPAAADNLHMQHRAHAQSVRLMHNLRHGMNGGQIPWFRHRGHELRCFK